MFVPENKHKTIENQNTLADSICEAAKSTKGKGPGKAVKATKKRTDGKAHKAAEEKNTLPHLFRQLG